MKKRTIYHIIISCLLLCLHSGITQAQTRSDSSVARITTILSVSTEKAKQIQAAYNYHRDDISALRANQTISPKEKQRRLKQLLAERQQKLNAVISPAQRMQLYRSDTALVAHVKTQTDAALSRHQQQINRMPHKQTNTLSSSSVK